MAIEMFGNPAVSFDDLVKHVVMLLKISGGIPGFGGRQSGCLSISKVGNTFNIKSKKIGETPEEEGNKSLILSVLGLSKLSEHLQHTLCFESSDPKAVIYGQPVKDAPWGYQEGALRVGETIVSYWGLASGKANEALMLCLVLMARWLSIEEVQAIAQKSNNDLVAPLIKAMEKAKVKV